MKREDAEKICRQVIANHAGEPLADNLFQESVDMLMKQAEDLVLHGQSVSKTEIKPDVGIVRKNVDLPQLYTFGDTSTEYYN